MKEMWKNKNWKKKMEIKLDFRNIMEDVMGSEHGISEKDIDNIKEKIFKAHKSFLNDRKSGKLGFYQLPYQKKEVSEVLEISEDIKIKFDNFVVLGIGGSALGNITLHNALNHRYYNLLSKRDRKGCPRIFFLDNIDPVWIRELIEIIDINKTIFNVITKSGSTSETIANFLIFLNLLKTSVGKDWKDHIIITTDPDKGDLKKLASEENIVSLSIPQNVGGRYSVLSPVGLLSAATTGIDINQLLSGAAYMDKLCSSPEFDKNPSFELDKNPAYKSAVLLYLEYVKNKKNITVLMPYSNCLIGIANWFRQMWAESLGKKYSLDGKTLNVGFTPISALGATDQHSQLQIYVQGPYDKVVIFVEVEDYKSNIDIPKFYPHLDSLEYLGGKSINKLIKLEKQGTEFVLVKNNRPNYTIKLPEINPFTIGQLIFMIEIQTVFMGALFNINPLDQPGVETGKIYVYKKLGRRGY